MKIIEYEALMFSSLRDLDKFVNRQIDAGWQPLGGIAIYKSGSDGGNSEYFCQAMVKYEKI